MAEDIGALVVRIEANLNNLNSGLNKAESMMENVGKKSTRLGGVVNNALSFAGGLGIVSAITAVGSKIVDVGKKGIMLASDLQEVQNVVDTTFGEGAQQINSWATTTLNAFGLSELQAKQFSGTMGAMLKSSGLAGAEVNTMSMRLTELAGDFSSFYNLPHDVAWEKIRSGISGETEPLKQLGINMSVANLEAFALSQGINKSWTEMTQAEQVILRYNYLMQTTKDAQGDFTKTQGGFANQLRLVTQNFDQLIASIAVKFLPILATLLQKINEGIKVFSNGGGAIKNVFGSSVDAVTTKILPPLISIFNVIKDDIVPLLVKIFQAAWPTIKSIVSISVDTIIGVLGGLLKIISGLLDFIVGVFTGDWERAWEGIKEIFKGAIEAIESILSGIVQSISSLFSELASRAWEWGSNLLGNFIDGIKSKIEHLKSIVSDAMDNVAGLMGFHSPAEEGPGSDADKWAPNLVKMYAEGIRAGIPNIRAAVAEVAGSLGGLQANVTATPAVAAAGQGITNVFNITASVRSDNDIKLIAREIFNLQTARSRGNGVVYG